MSQIKLFVRASVVAFVGLVLAACVNQEVSLSHTIDDFSTQTELNARLLGESASLFANVNLTVIEGRVHLSGSVPTAEQRLTAARLAWATPNVREVTNDIEITNETDLFDSARDTWINTQVRARILTDDMIQDGNYTIDTQNRIIYILGIAQDQDELNRVLQHARSVPEAKRVVNYALAKDDPRRFGVARRDEEWPAEDPMTEQY